MNTSRRSQRARWRAREGGGLHAVRANAARMDRRFRAFLSPLERWSNDEADAARSSSRYERDAPRRLRARGERRCAEERGGSVRRDRSGHRRPRRRLRVGHREPEGPRASRGRTLRDVLDVEVGARGVRARACRQRRARARSPRDVRRSRSPRTRTVRARERRQRHDRRRARRSRRHRQRQHGRQPLAGPRRRTCRRDGVREGARRRRHAPRSHRAGDERFHARRSARHDIAARDGRHHEDGAPRRRAQHREPRAARRLVGRVHDGQRTIARRFARRLRRGRQDRHRSCRPA